MMMKMGEDGKLFIDKMMAMRLECTKAPGHPSGNGQEHHITFHCIYSFNTWIESNHTTLRSAERSQLGLVTYSTARQNTVQQQQQHTATNNIASKHHGMSDGVCFIFTLVFVKKQARIFGSIFRLVLSQTHTPSYTVGCDVFWNFVLYFGERGGFMYVHTARWEIRCSR